METKDLKTIGALQKAVQLARIASDWNFDEVEIDEEMVSIHELIEEFEMVIKEFD